MEDLAKALREEMGRRNHSYRQAAEAMGVSASSVKNWFHGFLTEAPSRDHLRKIADYLGVPYYVALGLVRELNERQVELLATIPGTIQIAEQMALAWVGYLNPDDAPALATAV